MVITRSILSGMAVLALTAAGCLSSNIDGGVGTGSSGGTGGGSDNGGGDSPATGDDVTGDDTDNPGTGPSDPGPVANFGVKIEPLSAELVLGETRELTVTVTGENGFAGPVTLAAAGLPTTWKATFDPATVQVTAGAPASAKLILQIPTDAEIATAMLDVAGTGAPGERKAASKADVTVKPELVIRIPAGSVDNPENSFGPNGVVRVRYVAPGTKITWINDDTVNHRIHSDGGLGIQHQQGNIPPGGSYTDTLEQAGTLNYRCHIHGQMEGRLEVVPGP